MKTTIRPHILLLFCGRHGGHGGGGQRLFLTLGTRLSVFTLCSSSLCLRSHSDAPLGASSPAGAGAGTNLPTSAVEWKSGTD